MFIYEGKSALLKEAVKEANRIMKHPDLIMKIRKKTSFDMATCNPDQIADDMLKHSPVKFYVVGYYKKWTRALAYFKKSTPNKFYINEAKLNRSFSSIVATMIHEWIHFLDHLNEDHYYGHGDNKREGKQNTAPYWIDNEAQALVAGSRPDHNNNESSRIIRKRPNVFRRIGRFFRRLF